MLVPAQVSVTHAEMPQVTALFASFAYIGSSVGACIAGGIYTNRFKPALWSHLGDGATTQLVDMLYDSVTSGPPALGTAERTAINNAVSGVIIFSTCSYKLCG